MRLALFLLLSAVAAAAAAENPIDVSTLFSAGLTPLSPCSQPCLTDLVHATRELLYFKDTVRNFKSLCSTYENATLCVAEQEVVCGKTSSFALNADPVLAMCSRKSDALDPLIPCVEKKIDATLNECDSSCLFTSSLSEISRRDSVRRMAEAGGDNRFALITELTGLCPSTSCMFSCLSLALDRDCPPAGEDIVGALLRPFFVAAEMLETDDQMKAIVFKIAPPACYPFLTEESLQKMLHGEYAKKQGETSSGLPSGSLRSMDGSEDEEDTPSDEDNQSNLSTLLSASSGLPQCSDACLSDLLIAANKIFDFNNTLENFEQLCTTYSSSSLCVARQEIECVHEASFAVGVSGLEEICKTKKDEFSAHSACLAPHLDSALSSCDSSCALTHSINALIESPTILEAARDSERNALYQELSPVCPALGCMVSCLSRSLNRDCAPAGTEIAEALMRPFVRISEILIDAGPEAYETVQSMLPSTCHMFISITDLADIMSGVESPRWSSPSVSSALADMEGQGNELEEVILFERIQHANAGASLLNEAVQHDLSQQQPSEGAESEGTDDSSANWGRPGQISRGDRSHFTHE